MTPRLPDPLGKLRASLPALRGKVTALRLGWAVSMLALMIGIWELVAWRSSVMRAWPPSQRLYATLGLARPHLADSASVPPSSSAAAPAQPHQRGSETTR
jgi:hypothetical protein